jgi:hypothetical protein
MATKYSPSPDQEYVKGRRAGVEGTYGDAGRGVAERTVVPKGESDSGAEGDLPSTAHSLYRKAVDNKGDKIGDRALFER